MSDQGGGVYQRLAVSRRGPNIFARLLLILCAIGLGWVLFSAFSIFLGASIRQRSMICCFVIAVLALFCGARLFVMSFDQAITNFYSAKNEGLEKPAPALRAKVKVLRLLALLQLIIAIGAIAVGIWVWTDPG